MQSERKWADLFKKGTFWDISHGEAAGVLLLTLNAFLLLAGYYLLKTAREALIL